MLRYDFFFFFLKHGAKFWCVCLCVLVVTIKAEVFGLYPIIKQHY